MYEANATYAPQQIYISFKASSPLLTATVTLFLWAIKSPSNVDVRGLAGSRTPAQFEYNVTATALKIGASTKLCSLAIDVVAEVCCRGVHK